MSTPTDADADADADADNDADMNVGKDCEAKAFLNMLLSSQYDDSDERQINGKDDGDDFLAVGVLRALLKEGTIGMRDVERVVCANRSSFRRDTVPGGENEDDDDDGTAALVTAVDAGARADERAPVMAGSGSGVTETAAVAAPETKTKAKAKAKATTTSTITISEHRGKRRGKTSDRGNRSDVPSSVRYRPVAIRFLYDGMSFSSGYAQNVGTESDDSVERALFDALCKTRLIVDRATCGYSRAGRTDRGVSAWGQTIALNVRSAFPTDCRLAMKCPRQDDDEGDDGEDGDGRNVETKTNGERKGKVATDDDLPRNSRSALEVWVSPRKNTKAKNNDKKKRKQDDERKHMETHGERTTYANGANTPTPRQEEEQSTEEKIQDIAQTSRNDDGENDNDDASTPLIRRTITELDYPRMLNNVLPDSIRILGWCPVTPSFSARFSCSARTYRYYFIKRNLDLDAMSEALEKMVGRHDFRNLCKMNVEEVSNFVRVIRKAEIVVADGTKDGDVDDDVDDDDGDNNGVDSGRDEARRTYYSSRVRPSSFRTRCHFLIVGQAFLWHQIRCIVSILFLIGRGLERPAVIDDLLDVDTNPGKPSYEMAPESPLVLHSCEYLNLRIGYGVRNLWDVCCDLERWWERCALETERIRFGMRCFGTDVSVSKTDVDQFVSEMLEERQKKIRRRGGGGGGGGGVKRTAISVDSGAHGIRSGKRLSDSKRTKLEKKEEKEKDEDNSRVSATMGEKEKDRDGGAGVGGEKGERLKRGTRKTYEEKGGDTMIPWSKALVHIRSSLDGLRPWPDGPKERLHVPLMARSRGTTYEEKVRSMLDASKSSGDGQRAGGGGSSSSSNGNENGCCTSRRMERYHENIVKKKGTKEENDEFYRHMLSQGGTGI